MTIHIARHTIWMILGAIWLVVLGIGIGVFVLALACEESSRSNI
jgi:hypothetical protein